MKKSNRFTSLRVPEDTHARFKTLASLKGQKLNEYLDGVSVEKMEVIGVKSLETDKKRRRYDFKI